MRKGGISNLVTRFVCYALIAGGALLLLIFVPSTFWISLLGLLLMTAGLILLRC